MFNLFKMCWNESNTKDCNLVQQLKDKQAFKKRIDDEIWTFETYNSDTLYYLMKFFMALEDNGFRMKRCEFDRSQGWARGMDGPYGYEIIKKTLGKYSVADLEKITLELKALRELISTIEAKKAEQSTLSKEIATIKAQLGIE